MLTSLQKKRADRRNRLSHLAKFFRILFSSRRRNKRADQRERAISSFMISLVPA
jgi:hypothetical protein